MSNNENMPQNNNNRSPQMSKNAPDGGGLRDNKGKTPPHQCPSSIILAIAEVFMRNSEEYGGKYPNHNWRRGMKWLTPFDSMMRHLYKWQEGTDLDEESGLPHLAHAAANLAMLIEYAANCPELDNRYNSTIGKVIAGIEDAKAGQFVEDPRSEATNEVLEVRSYPFEAELFSVYKVDFDNHLSSSMFSQTAVSNLRDEFNQTVKQSKPSEELKQALKQPVEASDVKASGDPARTDEYKFIVNADKVNDDWKL